MATHIWALAFSPKAKKMLDDLPCDVRKAVFDGLCPLLQAENPLAVRGVCKVQSTGEWRIHADAASFNARVFFEVQPGKVVICGFEYKGLVGIRGIKKRNESTY